MNKKLLKTGERVVPDEFKSLEEYLSYLRHLKAYQFSQEFLPHNNIILEIGSGEGYGTNLLSETAEKIIGLDKDSPAIEHANQKYGSEKCLFQLFAGDRLPFEDNRFDAVVTFQVIEHIEDDIGFVKEAYRVLKEDGQLLVTTPNRTYRLKPGEKPWNKFHVREYYAEDLERVLKRVFSDVRVWGIRGKEEAQKIEIERIKKGFKSIDPLNLRRLIPLTIKPALATVMRKLTGRKLLTESLEESIKRFDSDDFYIIKDNLENSLDLLGICRK